MDSALIFFLAAIIIVAVLLFAVITFTKRGGGLDVDKYRVRWLAIEQSLVRDNEPSYHMAILNADKLLDQALKDRGTRGTTMGERLKSARDSLPHRNDVWTAHKLRNQVAHEPDVKISYDQARRALSGFKHGLKDLGAI
ncbi:MAG: hypothetical protein JWN75_531 [Candidatus Saccharibacteria bacterium]|jgi:hypothetical protein|nr:hypothetical protein [Candidatus Saccharibacteria bacterium]